MAQKLSITLMGRHYDISLLQAHPKVQEECGWLNTNIDPKDLLRAYIAKCQECAELQSAIEDLSDNLEEWL
ncbi:hypothetical protein CCZ01_05195 [Helicobacter monodelphidis]|uniref:hypothetical protein n=1 Tax=Helicobacter sp. 15-1451 TaxID=2004995 RepID=UPI000DCBE073|nr:hypothetical protein [Helicobacter sp. 15-1451]RAX57684.1 hypothetical protein CCZ01_05195 [Helicobacter sp. 15-1451]